MILDNDALEALRSSIAARGVTSLTDEDPTGAEYLWALVQDLTEARAELATAREALTKINDIRNHIVGAQTVNWSADIYPLVAALNEAGIEGMCYEEACALAKKAG